nr:vitamin B12-dependent ribonucleotide reductase [Aristophania vespae]
MAHTPEGAPPLGRSLSCLLLMQHMAPNIALWQRRTDEQFGFVLRLSGFVQESTFSPEQFVACLNLACDSLRRLNEAQRNERSGELPLFDENKAAEENCHCAGLIQLTDLDACLAAQGLDYDSPEGREFAQAIIALARIALRKGTRQSASVKASPLFPEIEHFAISLLQADTHKAVLPPIELGFSSSGPIDALLGVETCGIAPIFSPIDEQGKLRSSTLHRLASRGLTPETALALALNNENPLPKISGQAFVKMHEAVSGLVDYLPPRPEPETEALLSRLERGVRRSLPLRQNGFSQKTSIGGHRLFMRTAEFEDGSLGALTLLPPRESPMARGLMECLGQAVSVGLQFGVPLEAFIEQFAYTHFGPCGTVEGDPVAAYASSMLDYAFRALSDAYLGKHMPDAPMASSSENAEDPLLPFDHNEFVHKKTDASRRQLRLVS